MAGMDQKDSCSGMYKAGIAGDKAPCCFLFSGSQDHDLASWPLWTRRTVAVACIRLVLLVTMHLAVCSSWSAGPCSLSTETGMHSANCAAALPRGDGTGAVLGQFIDPLCATTGALVQVQSWTGALMVQTVQKTVELPQLQFRRLCWRRCIMQRQVQLFSRREQWKGLRFSHRQGFLDLK